MRPPAFRRRGLGRDDLQGVREAAARSARIAVVRTIFDVLDYLTAEAGSLARPACLFGAAKPFDWFRRGA